MKFSMFSLVVVLIFSGCRFFEETTPTASKRVLTYVFLGHTYLNAEQIDHRVVEFIDKKKDEVNGIDQIWLGGDMCSETTHKETTLNYLDSLFDLGSPNTHWALGNHDVRNGNIHWITERTQRPTAYVAHTNGITLIVMDNNYLTSEGNYDTTKVQAQYQMIKSVCDTIQAASHLVILSHFATWRHIPNLESPEHHANADWSWLYFHLSPDQIYANSIYPLLKPVRERGIQILNIAGDYGQVETAYEAMSVDSIYYIGSGITANTDYTKQFPSHGKPDKVLVLTHDLDTKNISWAFEAIGE